MIMYPRIPCQSGLWIVVVFGIMCVLTSLWILDYNCPHGTESAISSPAHPHETQPAHPHGLSGWRLVDNASKQRLVNHVVLDYDVGLRQRMEDVATRKAAPNDTELISLIRELLDPPSDHIPKNSRTVVHTPQSREILQILQNKNKGFFIEAGALDGERSSNTVYLEQHHHWTGLLIEMDPYFYTQLRGKNRRAWSINACLSPYQYPTMMEYKESSGGLGELATGNKHKQRQLLRSVPCFPLEALLLALNTSQVDYFSLDVEGFELPILQTIPFERLTIRTFSVEYVHGKAGKQAYRDFMEGQGYIMKREINMKKPDIGLYVDDFIFVHPSVKGRR